MSRRVLIKIISAAGLLMLLLASYVWLPAVGEGVCNNAGERGLCPFQTLIRIAFLAWGIFLFLSATILFLFIREARSFLKFIVFIGSAEGLWLALVIGHRSASTLLLNRYCDGLSKRIVARVGQKNVETIFELALSRDHDRDGLVIEQGLASPINTIFDFPPTLCTLPQNRNSRIYAIATWHCQGIGCGIAYGDEPPQRTSWTSQAVPFGSKMWVFTSGD